MTLLKNIKSLLSLFIKGGAGFLLLLPVCMVHAQNFSKLHDIDSTADWGYDIFLQKDSSYTIIGGSKDNFWSLCYANISSDGSQLISKKKHTKSDASYFEGLPGAVKRAANGNYIIPANTDYYQPLPLDAKHSATLMVLDAQGNIVLTKEYTDTSQYREVFQYCELMPDGGYLLAGRHGVPGSGIAGERGLLIRTDNIGNIKWTQTYSNKTSGIVSIQLLADGKILAGAIQAQTIWVGPSFYYKTSPVFMLLDSLDGSIIKDTTYNNGYMTSSILNNKGGGVYKDNNGGYYHFGMIDKISGAIDHPGSFPEYVAHLDNGFKIDWIHTFTAIDTIHDYIANAKQLADGSYLVCGSSTGTITPNSQLGWATELDKYGNTIWENTYTVDKDYDAYLVDGIALPSGGGFVFTGTARDKANPAWQQWDVWMLRVDSNGCLVPGCTPTLIKNLPGQAGAEVSLYPNPAKDRFTFKTPKPGTLSIYNMQGQQDAVYKIDKQETTLTMPEPLPAGIYLVRFTDTGGKSTVLRLDYQP